MAFGFPRAFSHFPALLALVVMGGWPVFASSTCCCKKAQSQVSVEQCSTESSQEKACCSKQSKPPNCSRCVSQDNTDNPRDDSLQSQTACCSQNAAVKKTSCQCQQRCCSAHVARATPVRVSENPIELRHNVHEAPLLGFAEDFRSIRLAQFPPSSAPTYVLSPGSRCALLGRWLT